MHNVGGGMLAQSNHLLDLCNGLRLEGYDFPTIWHAVIAPHSLVTGLPVQALEDGQPVLDIRLYTGQTLRFGQSDFALI